jgi:hypothetical protein
MIRLFIDPFLLACPSVDEGLLPFHTYAEQILSWRMLTQIPWAIPCISSEALSLLIETGRYPQGLWQDLKRSCANLGVRHIQPRDLIRLVDELFMRAISLEDLVQVQEVEIDHTSMHCEPDLVLSERPTLFVEALTSLFLSIGVLTHFEAPQEAKKQFVLSRNLSADPVSVLFATRISRYVFQKSTLAPLPLSLQQSFLLCQTPQSLIQSIDPTMVWLQANRPADYHTALCLYLTQSHSLVSSSLLSWAFSPRFLETVQMHDFATQRPKAEKLIRACAETLEKVNMKATHGLRGHKSGGGKRKEMEGAWRRDIDYEYHLHYWETGQGYIFDAVVVHNDYSILRPTIPLTFVTMRDYLPLIDI